MGGSVTLKSRPPSSGLDEVGVALAVDVDGSREERRIGARVVRRRPVVFWPEAAELKADESSVGAEVVWKKMRKRGPDVMELL